MFVSIKNAIFSILIISAVAGFPASGFSQDQSDENLFQDLEIDFDEDTPQPTPTTVSEDQTVVEETIVEMPKEEPAVQAPTTNTLQAPTQPAATQQVGGQNQTQTPQPDIVRSLPYSGQYYDADAVVPSSVLGAAAGPTQVDPKYQPGSSFVIVRKDAGPDSVQARLVSAQRALKLGRYSAALELYEQLYKKDPKNKYVLLGLAVAQQNSGFTESAIATYEELLKIDPNNLNASLNMLGLLNQRYPAVAYRRLKELWSENTQNAGIAAQIGLTSASMGNIEEATRFLEIASTLEPGNATHYYNIAVIADRAGDYKGAVEYYQKALEVDITYGGGRTIPRDEVYDRLAHLRRL